MTEDVTSRGDTDDDIRHATCNLREKIKSQKGKLNIWIPVAHLQGTCRTWLESCTRIDTPAVRMCGYNGIGTRTSPDACKLHRELGYYHLTRNMNT